MMPRSLVAPDKQGPADLQDHWFTKHPLQQIASFALLRYWRDASEMLLK